MTSITRGCPAAADDPDLKSAVVLISCFRTCHPLASKIDADLVKQTALQRKVAFAGSPSVHQLLSMNARIMRDAHIAVSRDLELRAAQHPSDLDSWDVSAGTRTDPGFSLRVIRFAKHIEGLFVVVATTAANGTQYRLFPIGIPAVEDRDAVMQIAKMLNTGVLEPPPILLGFMPSRRVVAYDVALRACVENKTPIMVIARSLRTSVEDDIGSLTPRDLDMRCIQAETEYIQPSDRRRDLVAVSASTARRFSRMTAADTLRCLVPEFKRMRSLDQIVQDYATSELKYMPYARGSTCSWSVRTLLTQIIGVLQWNSCARDSLVDRWAPEHQDSTPPYVVVHPIQVTALAVLPGALPLMSFLGIPGIADLSVYVPLAASPASTDSTLRNYFSVEAGHIESTGTCRVEMLDGSLDSMTSSPSQQSCVAAFVNATFLSECTGFITPPLGFDPTKPELEFHISQIREQLAWSFIRMVRTRAYSFVVFAMPSEAECFEVHTLVAAICKDLDRRAEAIDNELMFLPDGSVEREEKLGEFGRVSGDAVRTHIISVLSDQDRPGEFRVESYLVWISGKVGMYADTLLPRYFHCCDW